MRKSLIFALLVMGFSGIVAQILLLRELLVIFHGNELSIGIVLSNWLILEAFGCFFLGKRIEKTERRIEAFGLVALLFSLCFPLMVYLTRIIKEIIGVTPGESLGLLPILYSSFLVLLPVSIPHGALFTFGCKIYSQLNRKLASSIGRVYVYETVGTIVGGVVFTYLLIPYLHSIQIALGVTLLNLGSCGLLLGHFWQRDKAAGFRTLGSITTVALIFSSFVLFSGRAHEIHWLSVSAQWKGQRVVHYQNSIYGNIAVTQREEQYTFFSDGIPIITTPTPNIAFVEEFVHLPMLLHPDPKEILLIGGGAGGVLNEVLQHPVKRVDYVELDPLMLDVLKKFPTTLTQAELSDPRVKIEYIDGRLFVKMTPNRYDIVLVGLSSPSDLQVNRLFTEEFFSLVKGRLREEGILVIGLPGSLTYLNDELRNLNACILNTLKGVYPWVRIIPGDFNLFLASGSREVSRATPAILSQRLDERGVKPDLLTKAHIEYKLHPRWLDWFSSSLEGIEAKTNKDFLPLGVFYSLAYWNALFSPYMQGIFRWFERVDLWMFPLLLSLFTLIFLLIRHKTGRLFRASVPFAIATTGFAGMIFDLVLIFAFQVLYGYVYRQIGLLVTAFMVGAAVGSLGMTRFLERIKRDLSTLLRLDLAIILFSGLLPLIFLLTHPYLDRPAVFLIFPAVFLVLSFLSGLLIGAEFPLANKIYLRTSQSLSGTAGLLYGADLLGGWFGGILGGVVLLPVLGLLKTCMVVVLLKITSLILLATSAKRI